VGCCYTKHGLLNRLKTFVLSVFYLSILLLLYLSIQYVMFTVYTCVILVGVTVSAHLPVCVGVLIIQCFTLSSQISVPVTWHSCIELIDSFHMSLVSSHSDKYPLRYYWLKYVVLFGPI
jgi:hypothetical protein